MMRFFEDQDSVREMRGELCEMKRGGESTGSRADDQNIVLHQAAIISIIDAG